MAKAPASPATAKRAPPRAISAVGVEGFRSLRRRTEIAIRPLTILAGANSSGKSSAVQPLLLLKQTLEAPYDPGALLLDGPHVRFTSADQLLARHDGKAAAQLSFSVTTSDGENIEIRFKKPADGGFDIAQMTARRPGHPRITLRPGSDVRRERCFLAGADIGAPDGIQLLAIIHVPALRGNPERTYRTTAVGAEFQGTFNPYVASVVHHWQLKKDIRLKQLGAALEKLGLTWKVEASRVDDTQVELRVGRLKRRARGGASDLVSIADVGFGVSQCLPVLVALLTAAPGQLVYLEEPEIHLHPRAQVALAQVLADAANRGVRVVVETHSSLLLLGVQSLVAEGALPPELVALHWFSRADDGTTEVRSADLDETGAFGDWPEDFAEVALEAQSRYLDASEARLAKTKLRKATR